MQTWAIAKTLGVRAGLRQECLHDGHQLARLAAAMTETLALAIPELPGLADDKLNQAASSILFQELLSIIETSRPYIPSMSDAEILALTRSEAHTSELQSLMRISYAVFCLKKKKTKSKTLTTTSH